KLAPGGSIHSFGIHVARMAGMPPSLIERANEILKQLEAKNVDSATSDEDGPVSIAHRSVNETIKKLSAPQIQLSIFDAHSQAFDEIRKILEAFDINRLTPVEALLKLQEIKEKVK
ncbi:MAG: DNA mismatch repair protein MutS, partial [Ginsengibacter sp.]